MGILRLSEYDRKRYDLPDQVEFEPGRIGMRSIKALRKATGFELKWLNYQLAGVPETDKDGNVVTVPILGDDGEQLVIDGVPQVREKLVRDEDALVAWAWLILWNAGHKLDWDTFDLDPHGFVIDGSGEDDDEGKASEPETDTSSSTTP